MGLDIYVKANPSPSKYPDVYWVTFEGEPGLSGYYFFLGSLINTLYKQTGQFIDLYGGALFCGEELKTLSDFVTDAESLVESQPETWNVHVGTQTRPNATPPVVVKEIYSFVEKAKFQMMLKELAEIIAKAQELNGCVVCAGD